MAPSRKRRAVVEEEEDSEPEPRDTQRQRNANDDASDEEADADMSGVTQVNGVDSEAQLVKKLVRYALACDYSRTVIRRDGIREKVFGKQKVSFNRVFQATQVELRRVFGMEMVELPTREKTTLKERLAQKSAKTQTPSAYILRSTLPSSHRLPAILPPSRIPDSSSESTYTALYTVIYSLITLSGGKLADAKLLRYLSRLNAEVNTPLDKTEAVLQRMIKQGYIVRVKDNIGGEEIVEWMAGPRGKAEVGSTGVEGLVLEVYGDAAPEDLQSRIKSSLGPKETAAPRAVQMENGNRNGNGEGSRRATRRAANRDEDDV